MENTIKPTMNVIKPGRKVSLVSDDVDIFINCINKEVSKETMLDYCIQKAAIPHIYYIDNVLSHEECKELCNAINSNDSLSFWNSLGRDYTEARMFRDADTIEVNNSTFAELIWNRIANMFRNSFFDIDIDCEDQNNINWERELVGKWIPASLNHDLLFAKYPSFGSFAPHTDGRAIHNFNCRSFYSIIIFLNTIPVNSGGGTRFYTNDAVKHLKIMQYNSKDYWTCDSSYVTEEISAIEGRVLLFHQSLVHEGIPPHDPYSKYIIRTDLMYRRIPSICDSDSDKEAYILFKQAEVILIFA